MENNRQLVNTTGEDREKLDKMIAENNVAVFQTGHNTRQELTNSLYTLDKEIKDSWKKFCD